MVTLWKQLQSWKGSIIKTIEKKNGVFGLLKAIKQVFDTEDRKYPSLRMVVAWRSCVIASSRKEKMSTTVLPVVVHYTLWFKGVGHIVIVVEVYRW